MNDPTFPRPGNYTPEPLYERNDLRAIFDLPKREPINPYDSIEEQARIAAVEADTRRDIRVMRLQRIVIAVIWIAVTGYAVSLWVLP